MKHTVLVSLGCVTKDHSRTTHFPTVLEAGSGGQMWVGWFLLKLLPLLFLAASFHILMWSFLGVCREGGVSSSLLTGALIPPCLGPTV